MKLVVSQLSFQLKKSLAPFYLISGEEIFLIEEACAAISLAAKKQGFIEREIFQVDGHFDWESLLEQASNFSLFNDHSVMEVRLLTNKLPESAKNFLEKYAENPLANKILIFVCPKLTTNQLQAQWMQKIDRAGIIVQIWPIESKDFSAWISQRMQQLNMKADKEVYPLLAYHCEGNLLAAAQEIKKFHLLFGQQPISLEEAKAALADHAHFDVFKLVDSILEGNRAHVHRVMQVLKQEDMEPILILWALMREVRTLSQLAEKRSTVNAAQAFKEAGIWPRRQALVKKALDRKTSTEWFFLLEQGQKIDGMLKGAQKGSPWIELLDLSLKMAT